MVIVEDVIDTGHDACVPHADVRRASALPRSAAVTLLDRPYRRLVDDLPLSHVGFTVPDELFAGYGLGLDEAWRSLPDLHIVVAEQLPAALGAA